jgi:hypothetical protein
MEATQKKVSKRKRDQKNECKFFHILKSCIIMIITFHLYNTTKKNFYIYNLPLIFFSLITP